MRNARGNHLAAATMLTPAVLLLAVFVYLPTIEAFRYSLHRWSSLSPSWTFVGFENFRELFADPTLWRALINNTIYAAVSLFFQVFVGLVLAAILESGVVRKRLASFFRVSIFIPSILPITAIGLLWTMLYQPAVGLIDQAMTAIGIAAWSRAWLGDEQTALLAVVMVSQWQWTGYISLLFVVAIRAIPKELYEASRLDGAGRVAQFWYITVPGVRETAIVMASITVYGAIKVFDIVWVMTNGGPNSASEVLGTFLYRTAFRNDMVGYASAIAVVMFCLALVFGLIQIRLQREHPE